MEEEEISEEVEEETAEEVREETSDDKASEEAEEDNSLDLFMSELPPFDDEIAIEVSEEDPF